MKSTGEVMGIDKDFGWLCKKSNCCSKFFTNQRNGIYFSVKDTHKQEIVGIAQRLLKLGFSLSGTKGTADILKNGIKCKKINKVSSGRPHIRYIKFKKNSFSC